MALAYSLVEGWVRKVRHNVRVRDSMSKGQRMDKDEDTSAANMNIIREVLHRVLYPNMYANGFQRETA